MIFKTKNDIEEYLAVFLDKVDEELDIPSQEDWEALERFFQTKFPQSFIFFIELMSRYEFPGDIYNVTNEILTNGNDTITDVYKSELEFGWNKDLIPFYGIGNGDYFTLNRLFANNSPVFFWDHENQNFTKEANSFDDWLANLDDFVK